MTTTTSRADSDPAITPFALLAARFSDPGDEPDVTYVSFPDVLRGGPDPGQILTYLTNLGPPGRGRTQGLDCCRRRRRIRRQRRRLVRLH